MTQTGALLYVSTANPNFSIVGILPYGKTALKQTINGFFYTQSLCTDAAQNVYAADGGRSQLAELRHGASKAFRYLVDPDGGPLGCAVNPINGDLAVTNFRGRASAPGEVLIYKHARGIPERLDASPVYFYWFAAYDPQGDLFVDGENQAVSQVEVAELPYGAKKFQTLTLDQIPAYPGGMQWDGKYLAVGDQHVNAIDRYAISGSSATLEGSTQLDGARDVFQFVIHGDSVAGADYGDGHGDYCMVWYWKYPKGGTAYASFPLKDVSGVTVSDATRHGSTGSP